MPDLFNHAPAKPIDRTVGHGNALFLADLAEEISDAEMRVRFKAGRYNPIHTPSIQGWRKLAGRK